MGDALSEVSLTALPTLATDWPRIVLLAPAAGLVFLGLVCLLVVMLVSTGTSNRYRVSESGPDVGDAGRVVQRVTPVAGQAQFDGDATDDWIPVRAESGSIDIGEAVVVVEHDTANTAIVEPIGAQPEEISSPSLSARKLGTSRTADTGQTPPSLAPLAPSSTYELSTGSGQYRLEIAPLGADPSTRPSPHDGTLLRSLGPLLDASRELDDLRVELLQNQLPADRQFRVRQLDRIESSDGDDQQTSEKRHSAPDVTTHHSSRE
jgi:hypothetical protein